MMPRDPTKVFKVFSVTADGWLKSAVVQPPEILYYAKGNWTRPQPALGAHGYTIVAFADACSAREFAANLSLAGVGTGYYEVWECEAKGVTDNLPRRGFAYIGEGLMQDESTEPFWRWPEYTVMAEMVKPIKMLASFGG